MEQNQFTQAAGTHVGLVRKNNEDNFAVLPLGAYGMLLTVADGMGGVNAGEVAAAHAVETVRSLFTPERAEAAAADEADMLKLMKEAVTTANRRILAHGGQDDTTRGMGTTIVMAWLLGDKACVCWCGDSRCYLLDGAGHLTRLTKDHSYVQQLVDKGLLSPEEMQDHPCSNIITRCLGDSGNAAKPDTTVCRLHAGDMVMLCSDGLTGMCRDQELETIMARHRQQPEACLNQLITAALDNGGYDNVTVALCLKRDISNN